MIWLKVFFNLILVLLIYYNFGTTYTPQNIPSNMTKAQKILELIIKNKYFTNAQLLYAKLKYLQNDKGFALGTIQNILQIDPKNIDASTLLALICVDNSEFGRAKEVINEAMINNLTATREHLYFMIAKTKCEIGLNEMENSLKTLNDLLKLFQNIEKVDDSCKIIIKTFSK
jgi:hypothetical protein